MARSFYQELPPRLACGSGLPALGSAEGSGGARFASRKHTSPSKPGIARHPDGQCSPFEARPVLDLKTLVAHLSDSIGAIHEARKDGGYALEVPLPDERFQTVRLKLEKTPAGEVLRIVTKVTGLDISDEGSVGLWNARSVFARVELQDEGESGSVAVIRATLPAGAATLENVKPVLLDVAKLGDTIEEELTGGDVD
jgi:hypothetical protein